MKDVWLISLVTKEEKKYGKYPNQKPLILFDRIILASTKDGDLILDLFIGNGTTGISAVRLKRKYIGIEMNKEYVDISIKRYEEINKRS